MQRIKKITQKNAAISDFETNPFAFPNYPQEKSETRKKEPVDSDLRKRKRRTVLSAAKSVLRSGHDSRIAWRWRVAMKPKSNGGDVGGTMKSVYSTPMKKRSPNANKHGIQWCVATWTASATVHFMNEASEKCVEEAVLTMAPFATLTPLAGGVWFLPLRLTEGLPAPFMTVGDRFLKCGSHNVENGIKSRECEW